MVEKKISTPDGSLEVMIVNGEVIISSPRFPSVQVGLVDHNQQSGTAPSSAIYRITAFNPRDNTGLNGGDVRTVYVGTTGVVLDEAGIGQIKETYRDE